MLMLIVSNIMHFIIYHIFIKKDNGYKSHREKHCCGPVFVHIMATIFSFKVTNFHYSRFFGLKSCSVPFENSKRFHFLINGLRIFNIVFSILPMIVIDIYGIIKYSWGSQFYIMMIESLILSLSQLFINLCELKEQKKALRPYD